MTSNGRRSFVYVEAVGTLAQVVKMQGALLHHTNEAQYLSYPRETRSANA